jgi:hypothetical protein
MVNLDILAGIVILVYIITLYCIRSFIPFIYKYGITINEFSIGKMEKLDFSSRIGQIYKKPNTEIKVNTNNELLFLIKPYNVLERRIYLNLINRCVFENGEYKIITQIPFTYLIFPVAALLIYFIERDLEIIKIGGSIVLIIFIFQYLYNNWKMKFMLNDIKEFLNGIIL